MYKVFEINQNDQFFALSSEWNKVLSKCKDKNIFLTWEYLSTFWQHFGKDQLLKVLCLKDEDEIVAIAPLRQSRYSFAGLLSYQVVEPLGSRGLLQEGADYTGLICSVPPEVCLRLFIKYLVEDKGWDFIYLLDLPETSFSADLLSRVAKDVTVNFELRPGVVCPYISLPNSIDDFIGEMDSKVRKNLRRSIRNLERDYGKVKLKRHEEFGSVKEAMQVFFDLHQKRWNLKKLSGAFAAKEVREFYVDVAERFDSNGWLSLYFLTVNDEPIAAQYCFEYDQKMYYALGGFNPDYSKYSVGNIIFIKILEKCIQNKLKEYDLLKGSELYKFKFTSTYRRNLSVTFVNKRFVPNLYYSGIKAVKQTKIDKLLRRLLVSNSYRKRK